MDMKAYAALAEFGTTLFKQCLSKEENVLISPLSLASAMALLLNGAEGETKEELLKCLGGDLSEEDFHAFFSEYANNLPSDEGSLLHLANSIWIRKGIRIRRRFRKACTSLYQAKVTALTFDEEAVKTINDWVRENTKDMIDSVIDSASPEAPLYLINALAFEGSWEKAYEEDQKEEAVFKNIDGEEEKGTFLLSEENLFIDTEKCTGFVKPYAGGNYAFMALLPPENADFEAFAASLSGLELMVMLAAAKETKVDAALPKFKGSWSKIMNEALVNAGIRKAFTSEAEFDNMIRAKNAVGEVIHKTFIDVNEEGTLAGAVTAVMMKMMALPQEKPEVRLDRPFIYAIMDRRTGVPLFLGQLIRLEEK